MIALYWLFITFAAGWKISLSIFPSTTDWLRRLNTDREMSETDHSPWLKLLLRLSAAIWIGLLVSSWLHYLAAHALSLLLPVNLHPLSIVNPVFLVAATLFVCLPLMRHYLESVTQKKSRSYSQTLTKSDDLSDFERFPKANRSNGFEMLHDQPAEQCHYTGGRPLADGWAACMRGLKYPGERFYLIALLVWLVFAAWLMQLSFYQSDSWIHAGYSVFSDFAPHTALIRSFSEGRNFPVQYPHFAGDGISYHFMFFFLCGNLHFLGLPIHVAVNLPSLLGLVSFCVLLGVLALKLTGMKSVFFLAPTLLFLRSSMAFWTFLQDNINRHQLRLSNISQFISVFRDQASWIGNTPRDEWGLWGINVYANQRHLLPGLALAILVILILMPDYLAGIRGTDQLHLHIISKKGWLIASADDRRRLMGALLICVCLPFFHGSATVALLLILAGMAIFSRNRLSFLIIGLSTFIAAQIQTSFFAGLDSQPVRPSIQTGFLAVSQSWPGILLYLLEMSGLIFIIWFIQIFDEKRTGRPLMFIFMLPLVFAFTISMTPDITVNHKFIMISIALANIYAAKLLVSLWQQKHILRHTSKITAVFLAVLLTVTGVQEILIYRNINQRSVSINLEDPVSLWISHYTRPDAVFVTAPYHYHAFFLSGRFVWFGHSYYAWSAGHDTAGRLEQMQWLLSGGDGDLPSVMAMIRGNRLDYLLIDNQLREQQEFDLNEAFFSTYFEKIVEFPEQNQTVIYALR